MLYPAYIHKDHGSAYGVTLPDFPGCFSAADDWQDIPRNVQEAVELYFEGEDIAVPAPSDIAAIAAAPEYQGGFWLLVDLDMGRVNSRAVRLNVSLPESLVKQIDAYASARGATRSGFLADAARRAMAAERR